MNKEWRNMLIFMGVFLLIAWWIVSPSDNFSQQNNESSSQKNLKIEDFFSEVSQLHWRHMPLKYKISNSQDCKGPPLKNFNQSFNILENLTEGLVSFEETQGEADIEIVCINKDEALKVRDSVMKCKNVSFDYLKTRLSAYDEGILDIETQFFISGIVILMNETKTIYEICYADREDMGIYGKLIGFTTLGEMMPMIQEGLLINSTIYLYDESDRWIDCNRFPIREMHELLHSFGFSHTRYSTIRDKGWEQNIQDIMYPEYSCVVQSKVQGRYISCLDYIYSDGKIGNCTEVNFIGEGNLCEYGWFPVKGTNYCCPEENMIINSEGNCDYA